MSDRMDDATLLLEMRNVSKTFTARHDAAVAAVRSVDLKVRPGETVALVGESGSGKSTVARIALGLTKPDTGTVHVLGEELGKMSARHRRVARRVVQPVFQDPAAALNPRRTVRQLLAQAIHLTSEQGDGDRPDERVLLESVGLAPAERYLGRFPHELSGGQRQRLGIARALAARPRLIIADEPLSGADVSIRGQILNLLLDLQLQRQLGYLFITHDISIARSFAHEVVVMYRGEVVEAGPPRQVIGNPTNSYTRKLIASVPAIED